MSTQQGFTSSLEDLESVQLATINMRREYTKKLTTLQSKTLDLKFQNMTNTKYILEDDGPQMVKKCEENIDLTMIKEPTKINASHINAIKFTKQEIDEAIHVLELIEKIRKG